MPSSRHQVLTPAGWAHQASHGAWVCPPHLALLNRKLAVVLAGTCRRLIVSMPPRHGKSEFTSRYFPALYLGTYPDRRVVLASYGADFAAEWGRKVRDLIDEFGPDYFGIAVRADSSAADRWDLDGRDGGMRTAGVGGPLTGKGAHLLIVDDPIKDHEEANSETVRSKLIDWWRSTASTRLEPGGAAIVMATRWHESDLSGHLIAEMEAGGERWEALNLPALAEAGDPLGRAEGEALWPHRYDRATLIEQRRTSGSYWFAALYQGKPAPAEGNKFKRPWFRYFRREGVGDQELYRLIGPDGATVRLVRVADCRRFATVDLAFSQKTSADYTVFGIWAVTPESDLLLLEIVRDRFEEPETVKQGRTLTRRFGLQYLRVESNQAQLGVCQTMRRGRVDPETGTYEPGLTVRAIPSTRDKLSRAGTALVRFEAGQVYLPEAAPWLGEYEHELLSFPNGAHDDQVDVTSDAAEDVFWQGSAAEPDDVREAREKAEREAEARRQKEAHENRDIDDERWWS